MFGLALKLNFYPLFVLKIIGFKFPKLNFVKINRERIAISKKTIIVTHKFLFILNPKVFTPKLIKEIPERQIRGI